MNLLFCLLFVVSSFADEYHHQKIEELDHGSPFDCDHLPVLVIKDLTLFSGSLLGITALILLAILLRKPWREKVRDKFFKFHKSLIYIIPPLILILLYVITSFGYEMRSPCFD
jgi:hypothetical protein